MAPVPAADLAVPLTDDGRDMGDLVTPGLPCAQLAAQLLERLGEEGADEVGLQLARFGLVHLFLQREQALNIHHLVAQGVALEDGLQVGGIECAIHLLVEPGAHLGVIAVADGVDQQILETALLEHLPQDVEHPPLEGHTLNLQLLEQSLEDGAFARLHGHQVPEVADLGLTDPVDAAEALLQPVRVPRQVVIDHQVGVLQVHAFTGRVGRQQHPGGRVVAEQLLHLAPVLALDAAVDHHHRFLGPDQPADLHGQVVERVLVLGEEDELALPALGVAHLGRVLQQA